MSTYLALTTTNFQQDGYSCLAYGNNKSQVEELAKYFIGDIRTDSGTDIWRETQHKNLVIVSKTRAKKLGVDFDNYAFFEEHLAVHVGDVDNH